ncbi:MAG: IPTL-CTERM sorting domain-containing protein [candidate division Zixibacteria bacterium]
MKKIVLFSCLLLWICVPATMADWNDGDGHKMHYPQHPDPNGWDVNCTGNVGLPNSIMLADDFECIETGFIKDIHFWGSWKHGLEGQVIMFHLAIHENIPVGPYGYSVPGAQLWPPDGSPYEVSDAIVRPGDPPGLQGWYDPMTGEIIPEDHTNYFQYNVFLPEPFWFEQTAGEIYWLRIVAFVQDEVNTAWGWKTSMDPQFMDSAVWKSYTQGGEWGELHEPVVPIINDFAVAFDPDGLFITGWGTDSFGQGWYEYPNFGWWNIWFYDHPFDYERMKQIVVFGIVFPTQPGLPMYVEIAVNWSTDQWPPGTPEPPLPPLDPTEEEAVIGRQIIWAGDVEGPIEGFFEILEYNPEWVSIDVRGYNFTLAEGQINHTCMPRDPQPQSLDLAFVITSGPQADVPVYDLWETPAGNNTYVDLGCDPSTPPLPADFFGPGSDPFEGQVACVGEPLQTSPPNILGPTDTIVKRARAADLPACDWSDAIEIEIVALNLVSVEPITVTYEGGTYPELWDLRVCLSDQQQLPGSMIIEQHCDQGGYFLANFPVLAKLIFTRVDPPYDQLVYDLGMNGHPPIIYDIVPSGWLFTDPGLGIYVSPGDVDVENCDYLGTTIGRSAVDLIPGIQGLPCDDCGVPPDGYDIPITEVFYLPELCGEQYIRPPHDVAQDIPTLSEWGMILFSLMLLALGSAAAIRRRRQVAVG